MTLPKPPPALVLFFLSPLVGELLSGSSPPTEFFSYFGFTIIVALYGSGAVIVRELKTRWNRGIGSLLLLGATYGVLEEGLMVASFFNPNWQDLGQFATYGRWLSVNLIWAVMLTIYHAVYSITVPIVLVELVYPECRSEKWLGNKVLPMIFALLTGDAIFGFLIFTAFSKFWPPFPQYLFTVLVMVLFGYSAYRLPTEWGKKGKRPLPRPLILWAIGTAATFIFFLSFYMTPALMPFWQIGILVGPTLVVLYAKLLTSFQWKKPYEEHLFALASGSLTFFIVFAPLQELDKTRVDNSAGMSIVGLVFLIGLLLLRRQIWKANKETPEEHSKDT